MKTPFEILEIPADSDDEAVRKAYLKMVQQAPPEHYPELFQRIRSAYECIKTEKDRLGYTLFDTSMPDMDDLAADILQQVQPGRPTEKQLRQLLLESVTKTIRSGK